MTKIVKFCSKTVFKWYKLPSSNIYLHLLEINIILSIYWKTRSQNRYSLYNQFPINLILYFPFTFCNKRLPWFNHIYLKKYYNKKKHLKALHSTYTWKHPINPHLIRAKVHRKCSCLEGMNSLVHGNAFYFQSTL